MKAGDDNAGARDAAAAYLADLPRSGPHAAWRAHWSVTDLPLRARAFAAVVARSSLLLGAARRCEVTPARAPTRPRVVLLGDHRGRSAGRAPRRRARGAGARVSRARRSIRPSPIEELVRQALAGGARGVVVADGRRTEFWVAEEGSDRIAMRQELEIENRPAMESVLSLRTVEFLRVSLGLVGPAACRRRPPSARRPRGRAPSKRVARRPASSGIVASTGRLAPFATVGAGLRVRIVGPVGIELRGLAPLGTRRFDGPATADRHVGVARGRRSGASRRARGRWRRSSSARARWRPSCAAPVSAWAPNGHDRQAPSGSRSTGAPPAASVSAPRWSVRLDVLGGSTALRGRCDRIDGNRDAGDVASWRRGGYRVIRGPAAEPRGARRGMRTLAGEPSPAPG